MFKVFRLSAQKKFKTRAENVFLRKVTIWNAFYNDFATFSEKEKFIFFKKTHLFFQNHPSFKRFEKSY